MSKLNATGTGVEVVQEKPIDKEQVKALFNVYSDVDNEIESLRAQIVAKTEERSNAVKAIFDATNFKGPYMVKGQQLKIVQRDSLWFLRGKSVASAFEV